MWGPHIPYSILDVTRKRTSSEIAINNINCGKRGNLSEKKIHLILIILICPTMSSNAFLYNELRTTIYAYYIVKSIRWLKKLSKTRRIRR